MAYKYSCVVNAQGDYKACVIVTSQSGMFDDPEVKYYNLQDGERLIDKNPPIGFVKPKWNGEMWKEAATAEEIEAARLQWEQEQAEQDNVTASTPSLTERLEALESAMLAVLTGGASVV